MIQNKKEKAYTLAEIMVVVLILTVIFAAFAPLFTGRTIKNYKSRYNVWDYSNYTEFDAQAYTDKDTSDQAFFGVSPTNQNDVTSTFMPQSKIVVRAGNVTSGMKLQRHFQFRYGRSSVDEPGTFAGTWVVDGKNMLLGGAYPKLTTSIDSAANNVAVGYGAMNNLTTAKGNSALGYGALSKVIDASSKNNVAVGYKAGNQTSGISNVFIGSSAGEKSTGSRNVAVGYQAMGSANTTGQNNVLIGAFAGKKLTSGQYNVAVGYGALENLSSGSYNVAIGTGALSALETGSNNVAIGYNACSEVKGSNKTCIGYNAGPHYYARGTNENSLSKNYGTLDGRSTAEFLGGLTDSTQRTYIGSQPYNFGGDAVLEIHNLSNSRPQVPGAPMTSTFNTTTVINGNLIVRGRPYFTIGSTLYHFHDGAEMTMTSVDQQTNKTSSVSYYGHKGNSTYYAVCADNAMTYSFNSNCINLITNPKNTSDRRLKNIESKSTAGLAQLRNIKIYNYTFKNDKTKTPQVGVIAQELQKVFPNSVFKGEDGYLRISWHEMFYAVINGIKELDKRITALVTRTTNAEKQILKLEQNNAELKAQVDNLTARINKLKAQ